MFFIVENLRPLPYLSLWIIVFVFIQLSILLYLYIYFPKIIFLPFLTLVDKRVRREVIESKKSFQTRLLNIMDVLFYINFSFLIFFIAYKHLPDMADILNSSIIKTYSSLKEVLIYALILLSTFFLSTLKKQIFLFIAYLFNDKSRYYIFSFNISMLIKNLGLLLFPLIFLYLWGFISDNMVLYFALIGIIITYIFILLMSFLHIPKKTLVDYLNFILYFCGLEIIPLLIILKFLLLYSNG